MNISGVGEMGVGETGVGEMGQIIGKTGVGEMGVGETGTSRLYRLVCVGPGWKPKLLVFSCTGLCLLFVWLIVSWPLMASEVSVSGNLDSW